MIIFVQDFFVDHYKGGAELTSEAIIQDSLFPINKVMSSNVTKKTMKKWKDCLWIFGNYANLSEECLFYALKNLNYATIEYDYKHCVYRSIEKHIEAEGSCDCHTTRKGKIVSMFINNSKLSFWMSKKQMEIHQQIFPFLNSDKNKVLSSIFSQDTIEFIESLDTNKKNNKWLILNSPSWIKGTEDAITYAKENNLEYELVWNLEYKELLKKMASSKGVIFLPKGADTCPRWIIESKMLGCELVTNENVQHKDEEWFESKESVFSYLQKRAEYFWGLVEKNFAEQLNIPDPKQNIDEDTQFKIVIPFYNAEKWISKCIKSIRKQKYNNYKCIMVDDMSTDNTKEVVKKAIADDERFELIVNHEKKFALRNIVESISESSCEDNDVIILLDGDDWFSSMGTLSKLNEVYSELNCTMTYGSYVLSPGGNKGPEPSEYPKEVIKNNNFREDAWRASHLRSFKYKLWKNLDLEDLKGDDGEYYPMTYDQAIMLPLLEMSSERSKFISDCLYVYNKENPLNVDKIKAQKQYELAKKIRAKKKYSRIV